MLTLVCNDQGQGKNPDRWKTHIVFDLTENHRVNSDIAFGDELQDKYNLTQEVFELVGWYDPAPNGGNPAMDHPTPEWNPQATHSLHPLDMVTLIIEGPDGARQTLIVPAIFVKDLAHQREWGEVMQMIRLAVDIFIIVVSIATIVSGVSGVMLAVSIIDLGLATGDIVIQTFAREIAGLPGGEEFLDLWEKIYLVGGIATGLPFLGALLRAGAKLLVKATGKVLEQLVRMLKYAIKGVKNFPRFVSGAERDEIFSIFSQCNHSFRYNR